MMTDYPVKMKRKRGGQPGNRNAVRHGFYATTLDANQLCRFWDAMNRHNIPPEVAVMNLKEITLLHNDPRNKRALRQAVKVLTKWIAVRDGLNKAGARYIKTFIARILNQFAEQVKNAK